MLKNMIFRKYSFQKLTQFLQKDNVLAAVDLNVDDFPCASTCVLSADNTYL
jgi:hypothetical protein